MAPIAPVVSISVWKGLYSAAGEFASLQPWTFFADQDLICVRDPSSGETGFGIVMGNGGSLYGLVLYRGAEGLDYYLQLLAEGDPSRIDDIFALQNCLKMGLGPRSEMRREDFAVMKELNLTFKGRNAWPEFRSFLPGYAPWFLTEGEARFLTLGINAACYHYGQVSSGAADESLLENRCLMYTPVNESQTEFSSAWEPLPVYEREQVKPPVFNLASIEAIKEVKPQADVEWEADAFYHPSVVMDGERPYYVQMALACDRASGFVFEPAVGGPGSFRSELLADVICSAVRQLELKPGTIYVKNAELASALTPIANVLGIAVRVKKDLAAVERFKKDMMGFLASR